jgi:C4-dicarboxylate transporter DctM subunit
MIYFVVIGGNLVGFTLISLGITDTFTELVAVSGISKWQFLLIVNIILLMMGMVLDGISVIVLAVPILFPVADTLGINPVHFAVILTANVEVATLTPPVGLNLYVMSGVTGLPVAEVARGIGPFYLVQILVLLVATYVPTLSLLLLRWI